MSFQACHDVFAYLPENLPPYCPEGQTSLEQGYEDENSFP